MPTLDELNAFVATAQAGSFTAAAKRLGRDASSISRRVSSLEQRLNVQLLTRTTRSVLLTEAGSVFLLRAAAALDEIDMAAREASSFSTEPQGRLRISLPVSFGRAVIAPLIASFMTRHPKIAVDAQFVDRTVDIVAEGYDLAIRVSAVSDSSLTARKIFSFRNVLVGSPDYVAVRGHPSTPGDLSAHTCLEFTRHLNWPDWILVRGTERETLQPKGRLSSNSADAILFAVLAGHGITLAAEWLAGPHLASGELIRLLPDWESEGAVDAFAVMPPGRMMPGKTRAFVDHIALALKRLDTVAEA